MKYINSINFNNEDYGISSLEEITYTNLKAKRDAGELVPGRNYRIIDYDLADNLPVWKSAHHKFDIVCLAISNNLIAKSAHAMNHINDSYFAGSDLYAWHLQIDLDSTELIIQLTDEFNNTCDYDFKNKLWPVADRLSLDSTQLGQYSTVSAETYELLPTGVVASPVSIVDYWNHVCDSQLNLSPDNLKLAPLFLPVLTQSNIEARISTDYYWITPTHSTTYMVGYGDIAPNTIQPYFFGVGVPDDAIKYTYTFSNLDLSDGSIGGLTKKNSITNGKANIFFGRAYNITVSHGSLNTFINCHDLVVNGSSKSCYRNLSGGNISSCAGNVIIGKRTAVNYTGLNGSARVFATQVNLKNIRGNILALAGQCTLEGVVGCYGTLENSIFKNYISKFISNAELDGMNSTYLFRHLNLNSYNSDTKTGSSKTLLIHPFENQWWTEEAVVNAFSRNSVDKCTYCLPELSYKFWSDQPTLGLSQFLNKNTALLIKYPNYRYIKSAIWPNVYTDTLAIEDNLFTDPTSVDTDIDVFRLIKLQGNLPGVMNLNYIAAKHTFITETNEEVEVDWQLSAPFLDAGTIASNMYQYLDSGIDIIVGTRLPSTAWVDNNKLNVLRSIDFDPELTSINYALISDFGDSQEDTTIEIRCPNLSAFILNFSQLSTGGFTNRKFRIDLSACPLISAAAIFNIIANNAPDSSISLLFILHEKAALPAEIDHMLNRYPNIGITAANNQGGIGNYQW